ncbi:hypothetical protein CDD80_6806 [Ophiocordyceps camponoti-rufipedis]|uniref:Small ribosomal subunit protein mS38 n=1 Tax=Ophiocordyceps camponoti-rufipedis TaxID=2004952 RepID=A0A2C5ZF09_9HYPO|nr:hypothetical protein CDD80_6806 [Ophiocordyceps camponoti-rufipedis]
MLPLSLRRVFAAGASRGLGSALAPAPPLMVQRRASSSKPSRPDNDASDVPADGRVAADRPAAVSSASSRADGKQADKRRRKQKEATPKRLPCVPETGHISKDDLGLSSFFSQHRPISITQSIPKPVTDEHFASIFAPRVKNNRSSSLRNPHPFDEIEKSMAQVTIGPQQHQDGVETVAQLRNADGSTSGFYLDIDAMSGDFQPYHPPPLPRPTDPPATNDAPDYAAEPTSQYRKVRVVFTVEQSLEPDGHYRVAVHSGRVVRRASERSFLERMARRQVLFQEAQTGRAMQALSVRRQRKLRMKKKKYKKLQKRTRNLRRKVDKS